MNNIPPSNEISADIRNKLQSAKTALELVRDNKIPPPDFIERAINDISKVIEIVS